MSDRPATDTASDPSSEYTRRLSRAEAEAKHWNTREKRLSQARLVVFVAGLAIGWLAFGTKTLSGAAILPPVAVFLVLLIVHDRAIGRSEPRDEVSNQRALAHPRAAAHVHHLTVTGTSSLERVME